MREGIDYPEGKIKNISVPQKEVEQYLRDVFGSFEIISKDHFEERGLRITYMAQKQ